MHPSARVLIRSEEELRREREKGLAVGEVILTGFNPPLSYLTTQLARRLSWYLTTQLARRLSWSGPRRSCGESARRGGLSGRSSSLVRSSN